MKSAKEILIKHTFDSACPSRGGGDILRAMEEYARLFQKKDKCDHDWVQNLYGGGRVCNKCSATN